MSDGSTSPLSTLSRTPTPPSSPSFLNSSLLAASSPPTIPSSPPDIQPRRSGRASKPTAKVTKARATKNTKVKGKVTKAKSLPKVNKTTTATAALAATKTAITKSKGKGKGKGKDSASEPPSSLATPKTAITKSKGKDKASASELTSPLAAPKTAITKSKGKGKASASEPSSPLGKRKRLTELVEEPGRPMTAATSKIRRLSHDVAVTKRKEAEAAAKMSSSSSLSSEPDVASDDGHVDPYEHLKPPFIKFWDANKKKIVIPKAVAEAYGMGEKKKGGVTYLAYGLDMCSEYMEKKFEGCRVVGMGKLEEFKWGVGKSGFPTVEVKEGEIVNGVVFEVSKEDLEVLGKEGEGRGMVMREVTIDVELQDGESGSDEAGESSQGSGKKEMKVQVLVGNLSEPDDGSVRKMEIYNKEMNIAIFEVKMGGMDLEYVEGVLRRAVPYPTSPIFH